MLDTATLIVTLSLTVIIGALAAKRAFWVFRLVTSGQPATGRLDEVGQRLQAQILEVPGQKKLLKWTIPGIAHFFTMWSFFILLSVYVEAYGALFQPTFEIPLLRRLGLLEFVGAIQDGIAVLCLLSLVVFSIIRIQKDPERKKRDSRFYGSHTGGAWLILFMIFNILWTLFLFRAAASAGGDLPYKSGAFASIGLGHLFEGLDHNVLHVIDRVGLFLHIGIMLVFSLIVMHSKHLHIFTAPINVGLKRLPDGLGPLLPVESDGKPINFEDPGDDDVMGRGKIEDFTMKGFLDFATCTECGRCQSQCPAWNTGKPLSPKLVIMNLRDHMFAKAPYIIEGKEVAEGASLTVPEHDGHAHHVEESGFERITGSDDNQALRPLVGTAAAGGVIDPDVLWACTNCGACVEQCPVDIEHIDHIVDMRRYQVMMESEFPGELGVLFRNLENKGNPWGQNNSERMDWAKNLGFDIEVWDGDELAEDVEYLFFIGCAGAFEDKAKKTVQATAELLYRAGVNFVVLGEQETCTGDSARRAGNEFLFQMMAQQTIGVLDEVFTGRDDGSRKIVTTCPHCMNTIGREYPQLGGDFEVIHHTQLLNKLVRDRKLIPVKPPAEDATTVTYHDPCFLGRHNKVYTPPRDLIDATGMVAAEMPRHGDRSFCCGAGGARMWMEEHIGQRINQNRVDEAIATLDAIEGASAPGTVAVGCPFCKVMVADGLTQAADEGRGEGVGVQDVSQLLLTSVKRGNPELPPPPARAERVKKEPAVAQVAPAAAAPTAPATAPATAAAPAPAAGAPKPAAKGLGMKGLAKAPGVKAPGGAPAAAPTAPATQTPAGQAPATEAPASEVPAASASTSGAPKAPVKGLGMKGLAKAPGARPPGAKAPGAAPATPAAAPESAPAPQAPAEPAEAAPAAEAPSAPAAPKPPVKGLAMKGLAKAPGARAPGANAPGAKAPGTAAAASAGPSEAPAEPAEPAESATEAPATEAPAAEAPATEAPAAPAPAVQGSEGETAAAESASAAEETEQITPPKPKSGGLGFKSGARPPGKR